MTNNLDLDTIMNLLCLEGKITEQHAAGIKAVLVDVLEEVRSETIKEAVRVIEGEKIEKQMSDWAKEHQRIGYNKALFTAINKLEGLENNK